MRGSGNDLYVFLAFANVFKIIRKAEEIRMPKVIADRINQAGVIIFVRSRKEIYHLTVAVVE